MEKARIQNNLKHERTSSITVPTPGISFTALELICGYKLQSQLAEPQQLCYITNSTDNTACITGAYLLPLTDAEISKAAIQIILLKTGASVIQTIGLGFDKTFSFELMLRLKRPSTAVREVLNVIMEGEANTEEGSSRSLNVITVERLSEKWTQPQTAVRNAFKQFWVKTGASAVHSQVS